ERHRIERLPIGGDELVQPERRRRRGEVPERLLMTPIEADRLPDALLARQRRQVGLDPVRGDAGDRQHVVERHAHGIAPGSSAFPALPTASTGPAIPTASRTTSATIE